jgi:hypothetical protein
MNILEKMKGMSEKNETIPFSRTFSKEEMHKIKKGFHPKTMEQRFFIHFQDEKLFIYSLRSKDCIYIATFNCDDIAALTICRDEDIYNTGSIELDIWNFESIIDGYLSR